MRRPRAAPLAGAGLWTIHHSTDIESGAEEEVGGGAWEAFSYRPRHATPSSVLALPRAAGTALAGIVYVQCQQEPAH